jgi:hypothetical protein
MEEVRLVKVIHRRFGEVRSSVLYLSFGCNGVEC